MEAPVLAILTNTVDFMEREGATRNTVMFAIDEDLVNEIHKASGEQYSLSELQKAADKCFAHEWIKHKSIGEKYSCLEITEKGVGIVRSKRQQELVRKNRKPLKKVSDYIEDHKGLIVFLGFIVALFTLIVKVIWGK